jgi:hypothetical protein
MRSIVTTSGVEAHRFPPWTGRRPDRRPPPHNAIRATLDANVLGIVSGICCRLSAGDREITRLGDTVWSATGVSVERLPAILAELTGWQEVSGTSWLDAG